MNKLLSIIIPCFNKWNYTKSCIKDLAHLSNEHEIIIIDNNSTDETNVEIIKFIDEVNLSNKASLIYKRNDENLFHSKACNQGAEIAQSDNLLFLNNDIRVKSNHSNWTNNIINSCKENILIGPTMGQLDKNLNFIKESNETLNGNSYISGWCIAGNKNTFKKLTIKNNQIWNENYPMYFNDTDLSFRARKVRIDLKVIALPDIVHFGKISSSQINVNRLYNEGRKVFIKDWGK